MYRRVFKGLMPPLALKNMILSVSGPVDVMDRLVICAQQNFVPAAVSLFGLFRAGVYLFTSSSSPVSVATILSNAGASPKIITPIFR